MDLFFFCSGLRVVARWIGGLDGCRWKGLVLVGGSKLICNHGQFGLEWWAVWVADVGMVVGYPCDSPIAPFWHEDNNDDRGVTKKYTGRW